MRHILCALLVALLTIASAASAAADVTAFVGITSTPESRAARGFAFGFGLLIVGFEFEYASTVEDAIEGSPSLRTASGNVLLQTPIDVAGVSLYATAGGGLYRERLVARQETSVATNLGGGAKIRLIGPLRVRADYRLFRLRGNPLHATYHRFYVGANLGF